MARKRFDEYFAKVVLEKCFPEKFFDLQISDKPDLRYGDSIGIEVTNCTLQRVAEAENLYKTLYRKDEKKRERAIERIEQLGAKYSGSDKIGTLMIGFLARYSNDIDKSPSKDFLDAVEKKIERLNSENSKYADMEHYELFVYSSTTTIPQIQGQEIIKRLQALNNKIKKYSYIYFVTNEQNLMGFDMLTQSTIKINLFNVMDRLVQEAITLYNGAINE